jgi:hypothetical protein
LRSATACGLVNLRFRAPLSLMLTLTFTWKLDVRR